MPHISMSTATVEGQASPRQAGDVTESSCDGVAFVFPPAYGRIMSRHLELVQQPVAAPFMGGHTSVADCALPGQLRRRIIGPQVPGENPVHWIAERAPPRGT